MGLNELCSPLRCPIPAQLIPSEPILNIFTAYQPRVRITSPDPRYLIIDSRFPSSLLYRASCSAESRLCLADDAPASDTVVPDVCTPSSLLAAKITYVQFTHATAVKLRAC